MDNELSSSDKMISHPVLDNPIKIMKIIANPVYDKLTISRAAQIRRNVPDTHNRQSTFLDSPRSSRRSQPLKASHSEAVVTMPPITKPNEVRSKPLDDRRKAPSPHPSKSSLVDEMPPIHNHSANRSRTHSAVSSAVRDDRKSPNDTTVVRYVNSQHGFEIQRYSSSNWLSIDLLTKDACEAGERTFRQMLEQKEQEDLLTHSIFTSAYYRKRWNESVQSYKQGTLPHTEWAKQNYQLHCLKKFYSNAYEREKSVIKSNEKKQRRRRAQIAYKQWKDSKSPIGFEQSGSILNIPDSLNSTDIVSFTSNPSSSSNNTASNSTSGNSKTEDLPSSEVSDSSKANEPVLYMFDEQRWSLRALLKRVVGLAEPLPPPPKILDYHKSSLKTSRYQNSFESCA